MKKSQDQRQPDQNLVRWCRLRVQGRSGKMQYNNDPRKRGHHDDDRRSQCNQCQGDKNSQCSVDLSVTVIVSNADRVRSVQTSHLFRCGSRSCRIDHGRYLGIPRQMTFCRMYLHRGANTQYAHRDQQAYK